MPNHVHILIQILQNNVAETQNFESLRNDTNGKTQFENFASLRNKNWHANKFGPQSKNLASIIRGYKIGVTKLSKKININFSWQSRYYETIIKTERDLFNVRNYIDQNIA